MLDKKRLSRWINNVIYNPLSSNKRGANSISLRHGKNELGLYDVDRDFTEEKLLAIVEEIETQVTTHADGLKGNQLYTIYAYNLDQDSPISNFPFRVQGEEDETEGTEPPNERGLIAQLMRHNEAMARLNVQSFGAIMGNQSAVIKGQNELIEEFMKTRLEEMKLMDEAASTIHERKVASMMAEEAEKRKSVMLDKAGLLLPVIVNRLSGSKVVPEKMGIGEQLLAGLVNTLTADQIEKLQEILKPEQVVLLAEMMIKSKDTEEKATSKAKTKKA